MPTYLKVILGVPGLLFVGIGLGFMVDPATSVQQLGMPLLEGLGRSTQLGDLAAFFTVGGLMVLLGVLQQNRTWLHASAMLLGFTAVYRILAWLLHDAALAVPQIGIEVVLCALLVFGASRITANSTPG